MTVTPLPAGIEAGDHVCGFYYGDDERDALLLPFLRGGLLSGDRCVAVVDSLPTEEVIAGITEGLDADALVASGQLELYDSEETYLHTGVFDVDRMIAFWEEAAARDTSGRTFGFARVVGEMSWLERATPGREQVVQYESWADGFAARFPHAILCLYDLRRLGSGILVDLLRTHGKLLLGGLVVENPHHLTSEEFTAAIA